jgi:glycosyltransferase involved in cell wall biosynthesis
MMPSFSSVAPATARRNDMNPLVSVCCVTYNHERFIRSALDGFLAQVTDFPVEVIVHDDASTDATPAIIREYAARHPEVIRPIYQEENQFSKRIKVGATYVWPRARGKYIALCDGDDYWTDPTKLQKQVDFLESHPDYVLCFHDVLVVDAEGRQLAKSEHLPPPRRDLSADELAKGGLVLTLTFCYRNVLRQYPPEFFNVFNGDVFLASLLGGFGSAKCLGDSILPAAYRVHPGGIWNSISDVLQKVIHLLTTYFWMRCYYERVGKTLYSRQFAGRLPGREIPRALGHPEWADLKVGDAFQRLESALSTAATEDERVCMRNCMSANLYMAAALASMAGGSWSLGSTYLRQAMDLDPVVWRDESLMERVLVREGIAANELSGGFSSIGISRYMDGVRALLGREAELPASIVRRVHGRLCAEAAYRCHLAGDSRGVRRFTWHALRADQALVKDIGLLRRAL